MEEKKYKLSFLQRKYVDVTILKMLSPARFLVKEAPSLYGSDESKAFGNLEEAMDMYYKTYQTETNELPCSGSIVAVCPDRQNWYRAMVEAILETTVGPRVLAYLLDYGKTVNIEKSFVRKPFPKLFEVPFQALEFQLYGIVPCSLIMQPDCVMAYGQAEEWDTAAEEFVKKIISSRCCAQMNITYVDDDGILYGELLVSIDEEFVSLSKELISYQYASTTTKVETPCQHNKTKEKMDCSHSNVAKSLKKAKQSQSFKETKACVKEENEVQMVIGFKHDNLAKSVSSMQSILLKNLHDHKRTQQDLKHQALNETELHTPVSEFNESKTFSRLVETNPTQVNFTMKKSQELSVRNKNTDAVSINEAQFKREKTSTIAKNPINLTNSQHSCQPSTFCRPYSSNSLGFKLLQRLENKMSCIQTADSLNKSDAELVPNDNGFENGSINNEKAKDLQDETNSFLANSDKNDKKQIFESDCALAKDDTLNSPMTSIDFEKNGAVENSKVLEETCSVKLHHLQRILQRNCWKTKQELQNINYQHEKLSESKPNPTNIAICQNEIGKVEKPQCSLMNNVPDLSNLFICAKNENYLSSSKNLICQSPIIEIKTSSHSIQPVLQSHPSTENHIFKKFLNRLSDSPKESVVMEKSVSVNIEKNCENCVSTALCNVDKKLNRNNQNTLPHLQRSTTLKQLHCQSITPVETDSSLTNNAVNQTKSVKQLQQNIENLKGQTTAPIQIVSPKNMLVNAHLQTTMNKCENALQDKMTQTVCYGKGIPKPVKSIASAGFNTLLLQPLKELHFTGLLPVQTMMWPSVFRGRNVVSVAPVHTGKTFGYLLPLLSYILEPSLYEGLPTSGGPLALILCSSWKKAQTLHNHCRLLLDKCIQVKVLVTYGGGCERLQNISLINGCDVLIATPPSFLRLLKSNDYKIIDLKRCCYIVIDDGDAIFELFKEDIIEILKEYGTHLQNRKHLTTPNQIIVCCEHWNNNISSFTRHCMPDPLILIACPFEAAVYACVSTYCHFVLKSQTYSMLANIIDGCNGKRVVVCIPDDTNAKNVFKFLRSMSIYAILILSTTLHYEMNSLINDWNTMISSDTVHVLVITDGVLLDAGISNANCLIQCNMEKTSYTSFGLRYSCLVDNYHSKEQIQNKVSNSVCHILLTDDCVNIAPVLVKLLQRLPLKIPEKLRLMADERNKQLERNKNDLCYFLKAYGHCPNLSTCKECHTVSKENNESIRLPKSGQVRVLVCYVIDATHYYVRIIEHNDPASNCILSSSSYFDINLKLMEHYSIEDNCIAEDGIELGKICVVERPGSTYHRVRIEKIVDYNSLGLPRRVKLHYLDEGWQEEDDAQKLLKIPSELAAYPFQIVEVYICHVQPVDKCYEWTPQASTYVHNIIGDKEMTGIIVLTLRCTMWLEPFVHYVKIDTSDIVLKESNVKTALIKEGFAMANYNHIENLYALCDGIIMLPPNNSKTKPIINNNIQQAFLELNKEHLVYVYSILSPDVFFIQRYDRVDLIDDMQKELQTLHREHKLKKLETVQKGVVCIAPFSEDDNYYRACIEEVLESEGDGGSKDEVSLFFVDFGDKDMARKKDLYFIPSKYLLLPFQAIECSLGGIKAPYGGWSDDVKDVFDSLTVTADEIRKPLCLKVLKKEPSVYSGGHHYVVKLWEKGSEACNLSEALVNKEMGISINLPDLPEANLEDTVQSDDHLTDEENNMAVAMCSVIGLETSLTKAIAKKVVPKNKIQNNINDKVTDSAQKQKFTLSSNCIDVPHQKKCNIGYTIPQVLWWQKKGEVKVSIQLAGIKNFDAVFKEKHILFTTKINGKLYRFEEDLYDSINSEKSKKSIVGHNVELTLIKLKVGTKWPRLTACSKRRPYIRANFDYLNDSSSDSDKPSKIIKTNSKDIIHYESSDADCSSDDEEWNDVRYDDHFC